MPQNPCNLRTARDAQFQAKVCRHRGVLSGAAVLMFGRRQRAEEVVEATLAQLYRDWPVAPDPRSSALAAVLTASPDKLVLPWQRRDRVELVDDSGSSPIPAGILADLAALPDQHRVVIILTGYAGLSITEIAAALQRDQSQVEVLVQEAQRLLELRRPSRQRAPQPSKAVHRGEDAQLSVDMALTEEMRRAAVSAVKDTRSPLGRDDLAHGRLLIRRRRIRGALLAGALLMTTLLGIVQLVPMLRPQTEAVADPTSSGLPTSLPKPTWTPTCAFSEASCRVSVERDWRTEMARVAGSYVDPHRSYFSGYTYAHHLADSDGWWSGQGGGLGLDLHRLSTGSTEVYLQIATSEQFAVRCGRITHQSCVSMSFMDGNRFTLTERTSVASGIEVQYSPDGRAVITVVARNTSPGRSLDVQRAELISLVQDTRLRLPPL